jgi:hypothetical protein
MTTARRLFAYCRRICVFRHQIDYSVSMLAVTGLMIVRPMFLSLNLKSRPADFRATPDSSCT